MTHKIISFLSILLLSYRLWLVVQMTLKLKHQLIQTTEKKILRLMTWQ